MSLTLEDVIQEELDDASRLGLDELKGHKWFDDDNRTVDWEKLEAQIQRLVLAAASRALSEAKKILAAGGGIL